MGHTLTKTKIFMPGALRSSDGGFSTPQLRAGLVTIIATPRETAAEVTACSTKMFLEFSGQDIQANPEVNPHPQAPDAQRRIKMAGATWGRLTMAPGEMSMP